MADRIDLGVVYREHPSPSRAPLVVRCFCLARDATLRAAFYVVLGAVLLVIAPEQIPTGAIAGVFVFALFQALRQVPLLTLRARLVDGDVVVTGSRWPGPETTWSCALHEASTFEVETRDDAPGGPRRRVALRTSDGQVLGLTEKLYPGGEHALSAVAARLNTWLPLDGR